MEFVNIDLNTFKDVYVGIMEIGDELEKLMLILLYT